MCARDISTSHYINKNDYLIGHTNSIKVETGVREITHLPKDTQVISSATTELKLLNQYSCPNNVYTNRT